MKYLGVDLTKHEKALNAKLQNAEGKKSKKI